MRDLLVIALVLLGAGAALRRPWVAIDLHAGAIWLDGPFGAVKHHPRALGTMGPAPDWTTEAGDPAIRSALGAIL